MTDEKRHRNDIYGDLDKRSTDNPLIPAATVVLLRQNQASDGKIEILMLQKNTNISFGGMWVFPGGKIDAEDYPKSDGSEEDILQGAINAAARETTEETGLVVAKENFAWFAHWTPPASTPKRFSTWFFATMVDDDEEVNIDGGEITRHRWIEPKEALQHHGDGEIDLAPPTWITLNQICQFDNALDGIESLRQKPTKFYKTRVVKAANGERVAMWVGDAGYESHDADVAGERHRLILGEGGFVFENTVEDY